MPSRGCTPASTLHRGRSGRGSGCDSVSGGGTASSRTSSQCRQQRQIEAPAARCLPLPLKLQPVGTAADPDTTHPRSGRKGGPRSTHCRLAPEALMKSRVASSVEMAAR